MVRYDEHGYMIITIPIKDQIGIKMPVVKMHQWEPVKDIQGASKCSRCGMVRIQIPGCRPIYSRDGQIDNSRTKQNCFLLSKD